MLLSTVAERKIPIFARVGGEHGLQPEMTFVNDLPTQITTLENILTGLALKLALKRNFGRGDNAGENLLFRLTALLASNSRKSSLELCLEQYWAVKKKHPWRKKGRLCIQIYFFL